MALSQITVHYSLKLPKENGANWYVPLENPNFQTVNICGI